MVVVVGVLEIIIPWSAMVMVMDDKRRDIFLCVVFRVYVVCLLRRRYFMSLNGMVHSCITETYES